ncbi:MAG: amidohydrolase family protein [Gammaproteobacteria bacterium]
MSSRTSAEVRRGLKHPVIDADGHWLEIFPIFFDYIREVAGPAVLERYRGGLGSRYQAWYRATPAERMRNRMRRPPFWGAPTDTTDRAAAMVPSLYRQKLDDWGFDVAVMFPSLGFTLGRDVTDPEMIAAIIRAYNTMAVDMFRDCSDRLIPVGVVSLVDPKEAIAQLEHAHSIGLKLVMMGGSLPRAIEADAQWQPDPARRRVYVDGLGLDNAHDYDPVWRRFVELKMPVATHVGSMGWPDRSSPTNFVANHVGHFAQAHHLFARSLFLGGVTQRFPDLNFAFLEGGVGWGCNLLADLIGHWEKRNVRFMQERLNPARLDLGALKTLVAKHTQGHPRFEGRLDEILANYLDAVEYGVSQADLAARDAGLEDDFRHVRLDSAADIKRLFGGNFYFGCEADDPMTAVAFDKRLGLNLKPILGSDISHFDVVDAAEVLEEAWELVDHGLLNEDDFREFTFTNAVRLFCGMNPGFFDGTRIEAEARRAVAALKQG